MTKYVVGFVFNNYEEAVVLMLKARPDWQKGKLNGIGGHVEENESPMKAMIREWEEETSTNLTEFDWTFFALVIGNEFEVYFFRANYIQIDELESYSAGEEITIVDPNNLPDNVVSNLQWLIPMAKVRHQHDWPYYIMEKHIDLKAII